VDDLRVKITADASQLASEMQKAKAAVVANGNAMQGAVKKVGKEFNEAFAHINKFGAIAALAAVGGVGLFLKKAIDTADEMSKMAQKIGMSTENLSTLAHAADISGVSIEQLQTGFIRLSKNAADAANGTGEAKDSFNALGIKLKDANGNLKSSDALLKEIADKFKGLKDGADKTTVAVNIFGKSGAELIPMLNQGSKEIEALQSRARELGLELSTEAGRAAEEFNDQVKDLAQNATGLGRQIATDLLPYLNEIVRAMRLAYQESGPLMAAWVGLGGVGNMVFGSNLQRDIARTRAEIEKLQAIDSRRSAMGRPESHTDKIAGLKKELAAMEAQQKAMENSARRAFDERKKQEAEDESAKEKASARLRAAMLEQKEGEKNAKEFHKLEIKNAKEAESVKAASIAAINKMNIEKWEAEEKGEADLRELERNAAIQTQKEQAKTAELINKKNIEHWEEGARVVEEVRTETERYADRVEYLNGLLEKGAIDFSTYNAAVEKAFDEMEAAADKGNKDFEELKQTIDGWGKDSAAAIVEFAQTGKLSFKEMIDSMISDLLRMIVYQNLTKPLFASISTDVTGLLTNGISFGGSGMDSTWGAGPADNPWIFAKGGAFVGGRVVPFARGGVVDRPTIFPMAAGAGLMGEAGPEAVIPLARTATGDLGIKSSGAGGENVSITIIAADAKSFEDMCRRNPGAITGPVLQSLRDNKTRTEFKRLVS